MNDAGSIAGWLRPVAILFIVAACAGIGPAPGTTAPAQTAAPLAVATDARTPEPTLGSTATPEPTEPTLGAAPMGPTERATVVRVVDGDTIVIDRGHGDERLRYIGVDTPETVAPGSPVEWMGPEASAANKRLVEGRDVVLERDVSETDRYGRLLRYVWLEDASRPSGWLLVNLELVATGFAQVVTYPPDVRYVDLYLAAQAIARQGSIGLWGAEPTESAGAEPGPTTSPGGCDPAYPTVCIPPPPPDLDCGDITFRRFTVLAPDPHRFDNDHDGIGCES